jgi:hypothetical protein
MKTLKIEIPQGYEIDKEKSTFENIVFKEAKKELPKSWEELDIVKGYNTTTYGDINSTTININYNIKNIFATKEQAEASIAMAQLSQLIKVYNDGWVPDWNDDEFKYCIYFIGNNIGKENLRNSRTFLSFKDEEIRNLFLENFKELIEQAKPLI